ncbi:MAG: serine O-acetyltransferase [Candidatus Omnitrophica bacterium]|nr:serine O-acetyltransferase [Candidatus Omnitrophota bacterium]
MEAILFVLILIVIAIIWIVITFSDEIKSTKERDPAATSTFEILLTYAGLHALILHRIAQAIYRFKVPFFPRWLSQFNRWLTGIEIHPAATIGKGLFIDHGMGVVIGETTIIGDNVTLYQGVTLGGTGKEKGKRHPNIGDNVVIGAGAKVLGNITIGDNSYVGANAVVLRDVDPNSTVVGVPGRITKQDGKKIDTLLDHAHVLDPVRDKMNALKQRIEALEKAIKEK